MRFLSCCTVVAIGAALQSCAPPSPSPHPVQAVRTLVISPDVAHASFEYAAEIQARTESRLAFRVGGKMVRRHVSLGDVVKPGQVLAQLDPQDFRLSQEAARAAWQAAQVNLLQTQADLKRYKELRDQDFISSAELERRETALKAAQAQFDQAKAQTGVQGNQTAYTTLISDVAGVITSVDVEPGTVVAAGTPVLRLAQQGPRDAVFSVPEDKVAQVKALAAQAGQNPSAPAPFQVRLWGSQASLLPAHVREVSAAADPLTRTFLVKADLGSASEKLRLGQTATVLMQPPPLEGVTKLPLSALREQGGQTAVWVVQEPEMTVQLQSVQLGAIDADSIVILGGVHPGQRVVTAGVHVLTEGQKVKLYEPPAAAASKQPASMATVSLP